MDLDASQLAVEWVELDRLYCSPANPRRNDQAVPHVAGSIRRFGWQQPLVARPTGEVIAGNTRLKAAHELGLDAAPVVWFEGSEIDALAYQIADNKTHEFASWEEADLARILEQLRTEDALDSIGFSDDEITELLSGLADGEPGDLDDAGPGDPPAAPVTQPGDLWLLGPHRLLCGDATSAEAVARLTDGNLADMVWTDPPYGVSYVGKTKEALELENDALTGDDLDRFLERALSNAASNTKAGGVWYVASPAGPNLFSFAKALSHLGIWRQTLNWVKDTFVLGHSDFHYRHEPIFYGWKPGAPHLEPTERTHDSLWEVTRPKASRVHPTMKPVELVTKGIMLSSRPGELVLDPFAGSGTTFLAAEGSKRLASGLELNPGYCDVIVRRWEHATGTEATLALGGTTFLETAEHRRRDPE